MKALRLNKAPSSHYIAQGKIRKKRQRRLTLLSRQGRIHLKQDILEAGPKIRAVDSGMPAALWVVQVFAFAAVELHALDVWQVGEASRKEWVRGAGDAGAFTEVEAFVFLKLWLQK